MMYRKLFTMVALVLTASTAHAQSVTGINKPFSFGGALGAVFPTGSLSNGANSGFNGTLIMGLNTPGLPFGIRLDGAYNQLGIKRSSESTHITSFTGNAVVNIPTTSSLRLYLIGGAGLYNTGTSVSGSQSANNFGANIGGGLTIPLSGLNAFVEARYHYVNTDNASTSFVPVTFGIMF